MTTASAMLHGHLVGQPGSRMRLNTPALIVDRAALLRNIAKMAAFGHAHNLAIRPHAKTHKSADIGKAQIAAGATGLCCAKLGEAEALAEAGIGDIHITSPVVTPQGIARAIALAGRIPALSLVVDNEAALDALVEAANTAGVALALFVDIDPGIRRTGVVSLADAVHLALRIAAHPALVWRGVQYYCGIQQHIARYADRHTAIAERTDYLKSIVDALGEAGIAPPVVTGGGTGTHAIDAELGVLTELQAGSYIFMDREYGDCDLDGSGTAPFETALMVDATIISANTPYLSTADAGLKAFSADAGPPPIRAGAPPGSAYVFMGDEHGAVVPPAGETAPALGSRLTLAAPHCDPTVNLYDAYHVVEDDRLVAIWPVTARGRSA